MSTSVPACRLHIQNIADNLLWRSIWMGVTFCAYLNVQKCNKCVGGCWVDDNKRHSAADERALSEEHDTERGEHGTDDQAQRVNRTIRTTRTGPVTACPLFYTPAEFKLMYWHICH